MEEEQEYEDRDSNNQERDYLALQAKVLGEFNLTELQWHVLWCITYYVPRDHLAAEIAGMSDHNGLNLSLEDATAALEDCLERGWLTLVTEDHLARVENVVSQRSTFDPIDGYPKLGDVDFSIEGAELFITVRDRICGPDFDIDDPCETFESGVYHHYFRLEKAALAFNNYLLDEPEVATVDGPFEIGPWCVNWWWHFPDGFRLDVIKNSTPTDS